MDGGGLRIFYSLEILARIEELVRLHIGNPQAVLADHFDLVAGTSAGAVLATFSAWGLSLAEIRKMYETAAAAMFERNASWSAFFTHRYNSRNLSQILREILSEENGQEALLSSSRLRSYLLVVMRNATKGSAWPLCSHPALRFNQLGLPDCNLNLPLWRIVRASTAAPTFFEPERIKVGKEIFQFVDGGITPYNNPALIAALMATEPCYGIRWRTGEDWLRIVSVGTGRTRVFYKDGLWDLALPFVAGKTITTLIEGASQQQDFLCRVLGRCEFGLPVDSEVGDLISPAWPHTPSECKRFSYVRYNSDFNDPEMADTLIRYGGDIPMDLPHLIPAFQAIGKRYAETHVRWEHLR